MALRNPDNVDTAIRSNLDFLCKNSTSIEVVLINLVQEGIISVVEKETIMSKDTSYSRFSALYQIIRQKLTLQSTYPSLIDALKKSENIHIVEKLEESLNALEGPAPGPGPVPAQPTGPAPPSQGPVSNSTLLKARLSGVNFETFLKPVIKDIYDSTQSEQFMLELYSKDVINGAQKDQCKKMGNFVDQNDFLYGIVFRKNAVNKCIDALDNSDNNHILTKMVNVDLPSS